MTKQQAAEKLAADKAGQHLDGPTYAACIEAMLPSHARRKWRLAFFACRDEYRASVDRALDRCRREAGAVYAVGNADPWRTL